VNKTRIVFIDRDGVINVDPIGDYVKSWEEFQFEEGVLEALKKMTDLGFQIILISNQAGVGDGVFTEQALWEVHDKMMQEFRKHRIQIRGTYYCLHGKKAGCACRKPETGLFHEAVKGLEYDPDKTFFIGDKATDVEAGRRFGIRTIFVRTGHGRMDEPKLTSALKPDFIVDRLADAIPYLPL
jgi:D-glycero-D-manno-heptose 1,7-bisphosphate phosphatase